MACYLTNKYDEKVVAVSTRRERLRLCVLKDLDQ